VVNDNAVIDSTSTRLVISCSKEVEDLRSLNKNSPLIFGTALAIECELSFVAWEHFRKVNFTDLLLIWATLLEANNMKSRVLVAEDIDGTAALELAHLPFYDIHAWYDRCFRRSESKATDNLLDHIEIVSGIVGIGVRAS
jgi:hypothetical protein